MDFARYQRLLVVSIRKRLHHEARNVALSLMSHINAAPKYCIVVDEDLDVHNLRDVIWALSNRAQPDGDCLILPSMAGVPLDPSSDIARHSSRLPVDATVPLNQDAVQRVLQGVGPGQAERQWPVAG